MNELYLRGCGNLNLKKGVKKINMIKILKNNIQYQMESIKLHILKRSWILNDVHGKGGVGGRIRKSINDVKS